MAGGGGRVVVMMGNSGHLGLVNNALFSVRRVGVDRIVVFGLDGNVCTKGGRVRADGVDGTGTLCYTLPKGKLEVLCGDCSETRDVWSSGFADVAVVKPAVIKAVVEMGYDVIWMDTDIVLFANPIEDIGEHDADIVIQSGGTIAEVNPEPETLFRDELCTGFFLIKSTPSSVDFLTHVILELSNHEDEVQFGDQAALNIVLWEWKWRGDGRGINVVILNPVRYPSGGVFFEHHDRVYGSEGMGIDPVMVHNNFLVGKGKKVERFKRHGLWMEERFGGEVWSRVLGGGGGVGGGVEILGSHGLPEPLVVTSGAFRGYKGEGSADDYYQPHLNPPIQVFRNPNPAHPTRAVLTMSVGGTRAWFGKYVLPRMKEYALRTGSDLVVVNRVVKCEGFKGVEGVRYAGWDDGDVGEWEQGAKRRQ